MSLDTDTTTRDDVDLTAEIPCKTDGCPNKAEWLQKLHGCPRRHFLPYCNGCKAADKQYFDDMRALVGTNLFGTPRCAEHGHALHEPYTSWTLL